LPKEASPRKREQRWARAKRQAGKGIESQMANVGSWGASERISCQSSSLSFQRLVACLAKVVRCTSPRGGEPLAVVTAEKEVDALVGVEPQELPDDLDGEDLGVGELRGGPALTEPAPCFELIIHQTEDSYDEGAMFHESEDLLLFSMDWSTTESREIFYVTQAFKETCTRGWLRARGPKAEEPKCFTSSDASRRAAASSRGRLRSS
jgi:hypothetical protein